MNIEAVRNILRAKCRALGGEANFAREAGVSRQLVYAVLIGNRPPRGRILDMLGLEAVIDYRQKKSTD
jgi:hypothetical protein